MKENENKIIIVIFILMIFTLLGTLCYAKYKSKNDNKSDNDIKKIVKKKEKKEEIKKEETKCINYTNSEIEIKDKGTLKLSINEGVFNLNFNDTALKLTGINENIKSFTYDENAFVTARNNNGVIILLLSENNNVYAGFYELNDVALYFRKINTNLKIKDITTTEIVKTNKSSIKTAVVLENDEVRPIIESGNIYIISNKDTSKIEYVYDNIVIYKDGTISTKSNLNSKLKYNKQDMIIDKIISVKPDTDDLSNEYIKCYYIITNNRLFKLCGKTRNNVNPNYFDDIETMNTKVIIGTTNLNVGYTSKEMAYEIVYDDNSNEKIEISSAYIK